MRRTPTRHVRSGGVDGGPAGAYPGGSVDTLAGLSSWRWL